MNFCCNPFRTRVENAGNRGFSIIVAKLGGELCFSAQARGVDAADEQKIKHPSATVNVASEHAISFCPFCGASLKSLVEKYPAEFERLAFSHAALSLAASAIK